MKRFRVVCEVNASDENEVINNLRLDLSGYLGPVNHPVEITKIDEWEDEE